MIKNLQYLHIIVFTLSIMVLAGLTCEASAHPVIIDSNPKQFQSLDSAPNDASVFFSEPIVLKFSQISVLDSGGNRVDSGTPSNVNGDLASLSIPLNENLTSGTYTVVTKVLSAVDGHVVDNSVVFNIGKGGVTFDQGNITSKNLLDLLSIENSLANILGYVGHVVLIGAPLIFLWITRPIKKFKWLIETLQLDIFTVKRKLLILCIISASLVIFSIILLMLFQAISIGGTIADVISTEFGTMVLVRLILSTILLAFLVFLYRKNKKQSDLNTRNITYIMIFGFILLFTHSLISHAAALDNFVPLLVDYFHIILASIWIGGLIFLSFILVPTLSSVNFEELKIKLISIIIPRFSRIILPTIALTVITGPSLLYSLENNFPIILSSLYGKILICKIILASIMIALGSYHQFVTQKKINTVLVKSVGGVDPIPVNSLILNKFSSSLKIESCIGILLLFTVSLMANMVLPSGEFSSLQLSNYDENIYNTRSTVQDSNVFLSTLYSNDQKISVTLDPARLGENRLSASFATSDGKVDTNIEAATVKLFQLEKGIGPIQVEMNKDSNGVFSGNIPFSTLGLWNVELQGKTSKAGIPNTVSSFNIDIKPKLNDLKFNVTEYKFPVDTLPLYPVYHPQSNSIWVGDTKPGSGQLWEFHLDTKTFTKHRINGTNLITLSVFDPHDNNILWFIDPTSNMIGKYDIVTRQYISIEIPEEGVISGIAIDDNQNLWLSNIQNNSILKYDSKNNKFESLIIPTKDSRPLNLLFDKDNESIWFVESAGKLGKIDARTNNITEYPYDMSSDVKVMSEPTFLFLDPLTSNLFISDHKNNMILHFNSFLETFTKYKLTDVNGLAFGIASDKYDNLWIAQHVSDTLAVLEPETGETMNVNIPKKGSFAQYVISDSDGEIWFAEQRGNALGKITTTFNPSNVQSTTDEKTLSIKSDKNKDKRLTNIFGIDISKVRFGDVFGPLIVIGLILTTLLFIKNEKRLGDSLHELDRYKDIIYKPRKTEK
ncbi:MAG TPA: copper resistance protein CopC [Nitrososphaeraceae archaeon]|nr:copper resistance protein CopC [Nitrososphaeraceae archaeon]